MLENIQKWLQFEAWSFVKRYFLLIILGLFFLWWFTPSLTEVRTLLLLGMLECFAIFMSAAAQWIYTKVDFTKGMHKNTLGYIFLGVHVLMGLAVFGVYFVMFLRP